MPTGRVILRAEQEGRTFAWLLSSELADRLGDELREKGWTVTIRPESHEPDPEPATED
jgi:hypothetical protein